MEIFESFPKECQYVLETLAEVYKTDHECKAQNLSAEERLRVHQTQSAPRMEQLHSWLQEQITVYKVEPNSGLGQAIMYMLKNWDKLMLFLRKAGAPLDNNICERALKMIITHRKNSLFYKTQTGAGVGDLFMSLIYTCQLCKVNPLQYLTLLLQHRAELAINPTKWLPWNYNDTIQPPQTA